MQRVVTSGQPLLTHNYVVIETVALLQRRLGMPSARAFLSDARQLHDALGHAGRSCRSSGAV